MPRKCDFLGIFLCRDLAYENMHFNPTIPPNLYISKPTYLHCTTIQQLRLSRTRLVHRYPPISTFAPLLLAITNWHETCRINDGNLILFTTYSRSKKQA